MPPPLTPPQQPPKLHLHHHPNHQTLPDFLITAISLLVFISAPKHHLLSAFPPPHRRFLPNTSSLTMSLNPRNPKNPRNPIFNTFPTPQSLSNWLKPRLPSDSFSTWGTSPGTKNIHNLWLELVDGETELIDSVPPVRNLEVVCVRVRMRNCCDNNNNLILIESHQELSDGSVRKRGRPLSEKMKAGEDVESSAKRAIKEELGSVLGEVSDDGVEIVFDSYERKVDERVSLSYPGLPACYVLHYVDAFVKGLPEGEFVTDEGDEYGGGGDEHGVESKAVKCKRHFWKWVPEDSV